MSEFQDLPLPAIRDAQDYPRVVPAGQDVEIPVIGEFVYCKFSDGDVKVTINGKTTRMESGDERRSGEGTVFRGVNLKNDTAFDKSVIFVIGFGKFDRKIIQGEIVVDPRVKTADGKYVSDQRGVHDVYLALDYQREPVINKGDSTTVVLIDKAEFPDGQFSHGGFSIDGGLQWTYYSTQSGRYIIGIDAVSQSISVIQTAPSTTLKAIIKRGGLIYAAVTNQKYLYSFTYGRTTALTTDDRVNSFAVEGAFLLNVFEGPGGDVWAMDSDYKFYNMTRGYKAFDPNNGNMRTGCAFGDDVIALSNAEEWEQYSEDENGVWQLVATGNAAGSWNDLAGAFYDAARGVFVVSDNKGLSTGDYAVYDIEPESYAEGEIHFGLALESCNRVPGIYNRALTNDNRTTANVTIEWENGKAFVSGEVLKMALELLGIDTTGYLDKITAFYAEAREQVYNINIGGRTFAADDIADNFENVEFPQSIKITALNSLWSNRV